MADPLKLLREYIIKKQAIKERDDYIIFGNAAFSKTAKTNYLVWNKKDEYYTLESLYFFYKKISLQHTAYVKEAAEKKIQIVTRADRKALEDYLTKEKLDKLPANIDLGAPIPSSINISRLESEVEPSDAKRPRLDADDGRKPKERILSLLESTSRGQSSKGEGIRDLSKDLTKDKILALKQKRFANKRNEIQRTGDDDLTEPRPFEAAAVGVSAPLDLTKEVLSKERQWRTRTTCMEAMSKNFAKSVFPVLQTVKAREEGGHGIESQTQPQLPGGPVLVDPMKNANRPTIQPGYNRYDQERFRKEETEGFKIDTMGTYHGITLKSITEGAKPKPQALTQSLPNGASSSSTPFNNNSLVGSQENIQPNRPQKRVSRTPIIVIPAASTSLITMYNAKELLQDLKYTSSDEKKAHGAKRENEVLIQRMKDTAVPYRIVDNPLKLSAEEWDRVVAVFVQGPAWQFKEWPYGNPPEIFMKICAFHLKWDDMKPDANISKWAVNVIALSRTKRHLDRSLLLQFWEILDRYMIKNKSYLRF